MEKLSQAVDFTAPECGDGRPGGTAKRLDFLAETEDGAENTPHWIPRDISAFWKTYRDDIATIAIVLALVLLVRALG